MKRTATITFQNTNNFGAALQCYALQKTLHSIGVDNDVLNYESPYLNKPYKLSALKEKGFARYCLGILYSLLRLPRNKAFKNFRKLLKLSAPLNKSSVQGIENEYDLFISGSDQVWNGSLVGYDGTYFLDFVRDKNKKGSYAASFGFSSLDNKLKAKYHDLLKNYKYYNVRETTGRDILKSLLNIDANVTVDPTLLVSKEDWSSISKSAGVDGEYILVYQISPSKKLLEVVKKLKFQTSLKVVAIPFIMGAYFDYVPKPTMGPSEWLFLLKNARYVVTDSFHGTAFSMIFNRNVWCCVPEKESRINSLLSLVGIPERLIYPNTLTPNDLTNPIAFNNVNRKLTEIRENGLDSLKKMVYEKE